MGRVRLRGAYGVISAALREVLPRKSARIAKSERRGDPDADREWGEVGTMRDAWQARALLVGFSPRVLPRVLPWGERRARDCPPYLQGDFQYSVRW
jgi:hypothetical protein